MEIPRRLWRFPTGAGIIDLAERFDLPVEAEMQDWEYEVADSNRIDEFVAAYEDSVLSDDEKFSLMEILLESFRGSQEVETGSPRWLHVLELLENNIDLHIYTICYWACLGDDLEDAWNIAPSMRAILNQHRARLSFPPHDV